MLKNLTQRLQKSRNQYLVCRGETTAQRAVSRLRRTNDRSVLKVHEDHEDDENAENGVVPWSVNFIFP